MAWLGVDNWANLEWRARVPLAFGNKNAFDLFEPVADDHTLQPEPLHHRSSRVSNPEGYISTTLFWHSFPFIFAFSFDKGFLFYFDRLTLLRRVFAPGVRRDLYMCGSTFLWWYVGWFLLRVLVVWHLHWMRHRARRLFYALWGRGGGILPTPYILV